MASQTEGDPRDPDDPGRGSRAQAALDHLRATAGASVRQRTPGGRWSILTSQLEGRSASVLLAGIAGLLLVVGGLVLWSRGEEPSGAGRAAPGSSPFGTIPMASPGTSRPVDLVVHAAGAVANPGVYSVAGTSRVGDLVAAAGGLSADADGDRLNLAAPLTDGTRVYVPRRGEVTEPDQLQGSGGGTGAVGGEVGPGAKVDVNTATAQALEELPGVGPATSAAIVEHRRRQPFRSVEDLLDVPGIGPAKLEQLRPLVRV